MADMVVFSFVIVPITGITGFLCGRSIIHMGQVTIPSYQNGYIGDGLVIGCILGLGCVAMYRNSDNYRNARRSDEKEIIHFLANMFGTGLCIGLLVTHVLNRIFYKIY